MPTSAIASSTDFDRLFIGFHLRHARAVVVDVFRFVMHDLIDGLMVLVGNSSTSQGFELLFDLVDFLFQNSFFIGFAMRAMTAGCWPPLIAGKHSPTSLLAGQPLL